jgi:peptidoglycan/xylan/chitin deacetylase (PgdA/CDA1 family)
MGRCQVRLLAYHGVTDGPSLLNLFTTVGKFEAQMAFLKKAYDVISLNEAERLLREGRRPARDAVVITLDDDYKEGFTNVLPVAKKHGLPMTFFITTDHINQGRPSFIDALILAVHHTKERILDVRDYGIGRFDLARRGHKERAVAALDAHEKELGRDARAAFLRDVLRRLGFSPDDRLFQDRVLTWDEVREMQKQGIDFGAHTVTHPMLRGLSAEEAEWEIRASKEEIERETGRPVAAFAYPYGTRREVDEQAVAIARRSGYRTALTLEGRKDDQKDLFRLDRRMVGDELCSDWRGRYAEAVFACSVSGVFDLLKRPWSRF